MTPLTLLALAGLALVDSTSIGTLVLPLFLLVAPRVAVGRFLAYLATVAGVYAVVGLALVGGAGWVLEAAGSLGQVRALRWTELALGAGLLAVGVLGDPRGWFGRSAPPSGSTGRVSRWRERLAGPDASYAAVVGLGLVAALVELGSMLPFLAAVGIVTAAGLATWQWVLVVLAYVVVMVVPALLLLVGRLALGARLRRPLERFATWTDRQAGGAAYWAMAIVGLVLLQDARTALGLG